MFRPRLRIPRLGLRQQPVLRRRLHNVPPLPHDLRAGVHELLSADGFDMGWTQYQTLMVMKLNALTAGTENESRDAKSVLLATAREPSQAAIFNYASMAYNNHFFYKNIHPGPDPVPIPEDLREQLELSFGSIDTLRREMVATATGMFGPGFVWLVRLANAKDAAYGPSHHFRIVPTYLAGSPLAGAHWRRQGVDMNTVGGASAEGQQGARDYFNKQRQALGGGSGWDMDPSQPFGALMAAANPIPERQEAPGGIDIVPVLCVNTWEHVWLRDWPLLNEGVDGKKAFIEAWWNRIDWDAVAGMAKVGRPAMW